MTALTHASFFSGVGGLDIGFTRAGIRTVSHSEIDPYASAVLARHWPEVPNLGDIVALNERDAGGAYEGNEDWKKADIWSGGFPCQDLSVAGKRAGFSGKRSSLAFTYLDLVERHRPRWLVLENVPGIFSSNEGRDFGRLLDEVVGLGYGVAWRTLDARYFNVAQRRRRVFLVAADENAFGGLGAERASEVLFECEGGCGHLEAGGATREATARDAGGSVEVVGALTRRFHKGVNSTVDEPLIVGAALDSRGVRAVDGVARRLDDRARLEDPQRVGNFELYDFPDEPVSQSLNARRARDTIAYGQDETLSFPSRFGSNADITKGVAQSFAHSAGAPAVMVGTSYDGLNQKVDPDGAHRTLRIGRDSSDFVVAGPGVDADPLLPEGLDSHRYRCCGNGIVSGVAEFIARRIVAVDGRHR